MNGVKVTPARVDFGDILLNRRYPQYITVTNNYTAAVRFKVTTSTARLTVNEPSISLHAGQSIVLTIFLFVNHRGDIDRANDDYIRFHSDFEDFQVKVEYSIAQSMRSSSPARGSSPNRSGMVSGNIRPQSSFRSKRNEKEIIEEQAAQVKNLNNKVVELEKILGNLKSKYPDLDAVVASRLKIQEQEFQDKSEGVGLFELSNNIHVYLFSTLRSWKSSRRRTERSAICVLLSRRHRPRRRRTKSCEPARPTTERWQKARASTSGHSERLSRRARTLSCAPCSWRMTRRKVS
jgi:hypothetical protein